MHSQCGAWSWTCSNRTLWCHHLAASHRKCVLMGVITASLLCVSAWRLCVCLIAGQPSRHRRLSGGRVHVRRLQRKSRLLLHTVVTWQEAPGCVSLSLCFGFNQRWWCRLCCLGTVTAPPAGSLLLWNWHVVANRSWFVFLLILRPRVVCCEGKPSSLCGCILPFAHFLCPSFSLHWTKIWVKSSDGVDLSASGNVRFALFSFLFIYNI